MATLAWVSYSEFAVIVLIVSSMIGFPIVLFRIRGKK